MATDSQGSGASKTPPDPVQPAIAGMAAWLLPGLGYWLIGEKARGVTVGVTVVCLFIMGMLIGGVRVLEVPTFDHGQPTVNTTLLAEVRSKPWSMAQIMTGPIAIAAGAVSVKVSRPSDSMPLVDPDSPYDESRNPHLPVGSDSHSRVNEIAVLYTAVAGMLNLLAIIDTSHRAGQMREAA